jgi:WD40 repeat protein
LKFEPDGTSVISTSIDGVATLWDTLVTPGRGLASFGAPTKNACYYADFLPGNILGVLFSKGVYRQWDLKTKKCIEHLTNLTSQKSNTITNFGYNRATDELLIPDGDSVSVYSHKGAGQKLKTVHCDDLGYIANIEKLMITCGVGLDCTAVLWKFCEELNETDDLSFDVNRLLGIY